MLPPKLAQIIINLAVGPAEFAKVSPKLSGDICLAPEDNTKMRAGRARTRLLDPFCGTGVILQEARLMGYDAYGTDLEPRMIDYTRTNLEWLTAKYQLPATDHQSEAADATNHHWKPQPDVIATETYLGRPFTAPPSTEVLGQTVSDCNLILKKFLQNIHGQLAPGTRLCLAIPAWQIKPGQFRHLPLIDQISDIGYNRVRFDRVRDEDLLYFRSDQIVARELLVTTRK
jgi:SAM-dependent methyltransferase